MTSWSCSWYNHRCTIPGPPSCHVMRRHHAFQNIPPKIIVIRAGHATIYLTMPQRHCDNMLGLLWHAKRREQIIKAPVSSKLCCLHMFITTRQQFVGHLTLSPCRNSCRECPALNLFAYVSSVEPFSFAKFELCNRIYPRNVLSSL